MIVTDFKKQNKLCYLVIKSTITSKLSWMKHSLFSLAGCNDDRFATIKLPPVENAHSDEHEDASMPKYILANSATSGKRVLFFFHHSNGSEFVSTSKSKYRLTCNDKLSSTDLDWKLSITSSRTRLAVDASVGSFHAETV